MSLSTDQSIRTIPTMPAAEADRWRMTWRMLEQLQTQIEITQQELAFFKSQEQRTKWAGQYVEEAVARVFGIDRLAFYGTRSLGRAAAQAAIVNEARFILYTVLHHVIGVPVPDLRQYYDNNTRNYLERWKPIFDLVHKPRHLDDAKRQANYDRYAHRYRATYQAMRQAMIDDGVWLNQYNDPLLAEAQPNPL